ncbi:MAG TPA: hypothetical protein VJ506_07660 [Candidatus Limnocylindrales bacterium]|nr:hypothetical protein [Candidatus Limnocylindrales bacterium]
MPAADPSIVGLIAAGALDADLAAIVWLLVEGRLPLVVAAPAGRIGAGAQVLHGALASLGVEPDDVAAATAALDRPGAWQLVHDGRRGAVLEADSLDDVRKVLARAPFRLSPQELTFLGCVLVLRPRGEQAAGPLRVTAAHYVRPLARDAHGHAQELPPAVLATWDQRLARYESFAWGVLPEIAARLGRPTADVDADLHHRRDDLAGLAAAGVTALDEVRTLIAGYRVGYGGPHGGSPSGGAVH